MQCIALMCTGNMGPRNATGKATWTKPYTLRCSTDAEDGRLLCWVHRRAFKNDNRQGRIQVIEGYSLADVAAKEGLKS